MIPEFRAFPKIARLNRDIVITEKIDGTNAAVGVTEGGEVYAQSRTRIITPEADNFGFARWVSEHADELAYVLGEGLHFGEWWGSGIQRGYGLDHKAFSLFNPSRYPDLGTAWSPAPDIRVVPILYEGPFDQGAIDWQLEMLRAKGSWAAPGYMNPEGIVVYHVAARTMFKITLEGDASPKSALVA